MPEGANFIYEQNLKHLIYLRLGLDVQAFLYNGSIGQNVDAGKLNQSTLNKKKKKWKELSQYYIARWA